MDRSVRRHGLTLGLLHAAVEYARADWATVIEGYPVAPEAHLYTYMGVIATFELAGFGKVRALPDGRRIMRYRVDTEAQPN